MDRKKKENPKKKLTKKQMRKRKMTIFAVEIVVLLILLVVLFFFLKLNKMDVTDIKEKDLQTNGISADEQERMKEYTMIAIFGLDNRTNGNLESGNTDTIMIAAIHKKTKEVKLLSVYRDTYLNVKDDTYAKVNSAYARGGPKNAIDTLNTNLDLMITKYVAVDFNALVETIDLLGGIEVDVTPAEVAKINEYAGEVSQVTGVQYSYLSGSGVLRLSGVQATAYARIRKLAGDDYKRTERQRTVIEAMLKKAQSSSLTTLNNIIDEVFDDVSTNMKPADMISLASSVLSFNMGETTGFPFELKTKDMGKKGSCIIPLDLEKNVSELHAWFFGSENYEPTKDVQEKSDYIVNETGYTKNTESIQVQ